MTDVLVEMYVDGAWADITSDVYTRDNITITRGKSNEASQAAPASCQLTLNNRAGKYSPRNPLSPYYGKIGRNTPIRVAKSGGPVTFADFTGAHNSFISTPDIAALDILGDIDIRAEIELSEVSTSTMMLASKGDSTPGKAYGFGLRSGNVLRLSWSADGSTFIDRDATVAFPTGRIAVRATLDVDNGAAGHTVVFYTAPSIAGPWTQLGSSIITAGITSIANSGNSLALGRNWNTASWHLIGRMYAFQLRNGIAGSVVANPDFTAQAPGATSFTDSAGRTWTLPSSFPGVFIRDWIRRFWGEVSSFPARWDTSGNDAYVQIECAGILRRLGQGVASPASGLQDVILANVATLRGYWPLAGPFGTRYSLDIGATPGSRFYGWPSTGTGAPSFKYGEPLGTNLGTGVSVFDTLGGYLRGDVGSGASTVAADFVFQSPDLGSLNLVVDDYSGYSWTLVMNGSVASVTLDAPGSSVTSTLGTSAALPELSDTLVHHARLSLTKSGANTIWTVYVDGVSVLTGTQASYNLDGCSMVRFFYTRTTHSWVVLGHVAVWETTFPTAAALTLAMNGYAGEAMGTRIARITSLAGYSLTTVGTASNTLPMGVQHAEELLTQLRDAETTDLGILTEPRDAFGLLYRTRRSLYNQTAKLTLNYGAGHLAPPLEPVDDDQLTRNDITAVRRDGDSYRLTRETGAMSVLEPPNGVGRYKDEYTANVETDNQLPQIAGWLLHQGTIDEARYPSVRVNLASPAAAAIVAAALATDIGDRIVITNAAAVNVYDAVSLIALGYQETIGPVEHTLVFNCAPGSTYEVLRLDNPTSRIGSGDASTLTSSLTTTATSMSVTSTAGTVWTTAAGQMPISLMIGGEEMTVTAISPGPGEGFEDATLDFTVSGTWSRVSTQAHTGLWSFASATIADSQTSDAVVTVPVGATTVRFWYRVSSEANADYFRFLIDGVQQFQASGNTGLWVQSAEYDVSSASTLTFRYAKDVSIAVGEDKAYIDDVVFGGSGGTKQQDFTVSRAVNGVVKTHSAGEVVRLKRRAVWAL